MKELITLYSLRYGIYDTLTFIAAGFVQATEEISSMTEEGKRVYLDVATEIYALRNKLTR